MFLKGKGASRTKEGEAASIKKPGRRQSIPEMTAACPFVSPKGAGFYSML
jgi:hypothetical protein